MRLLAVLLPLVASQRMYINVPVMDLRAKPEGSLGNWVDNDALSQGHWGECVTFLHAVNTQWALVRIDDQLMLKPRNLNGSLVGYEGYALQSQLSPITDPLYRCEDESRVWLIANHHAVHVYRRKCWNPGCVGSDIVLRASIGTRFRPLSERQHHTEDGWLQVRLPDGAVGWVLDSDVHWYTPAKRVEASRLPNLIRAAYSMRGWIYLFSGRSSFDPAVPLASRQLTGVDCSGLVGLAHQTVGVILPRDADAMFVASRHGPNVPIKPGTAFFEAPKSTGRPTHTLLYVGEGVLIESTVGSSNATRSIAVQDRFGAPVSELQYGQGVGDGSYILLWGDYLDD